MTPKFNMTIAEFCASFNISKALLYKLIKIGQGPRLFKVGRRTLISLEAATDWQRKLEQKTPQIECQEIAHKMRYTPAL